ncbi:right-handed parallel beta-helix repeat-containing protein [Glutamicibacter sp. X7]
MLHPPVERGGRSRLPRALMTVVVTGSLLASALPAASAATYYVSDSMNRTVSEGWGSPDSGPAYELNHPERFALANGVGSLALFPGKSSVATLDIDQRDVAAGVDLSFDSLPTSGSIYASLAARQGSNGRYDATLRLLASGELRLEVARHLNGTKTVLEHVRIAESVHPGESFHLDFNVSGDSETALSARAYRAGSTAPDWQVQHTDSDSALSAAGDVRLTGYLSSSASKNSGLHVDNLRAKEAPKNLLSEEPGTAEPAPVPEPSPTPEPEPSPTPSPEPVEEAPALPAGALYVAPGGSDSASGSADAPLRQLATAVAKASSGQSIVVRGGTYHESITIPSGKTVHLVNYPGEKVWLDGASTLSGFTASGGAWATGWDLDFDHSPTYTRGAEDNQQEAWGFINSDYPMAAHPEQLWIDGAPQTQVGSLDQVRAGTFYIDFSANKLYVGSDPHGKKIEASTLVKALSIRGANSTVDGINVRRYAPSVPDMGAITAEKPGIALRNLSVEDSATTGINVSTTTNTISNVNIRRSGMLGMNAVYADGLKVQDLNSSGNNTERFNSSPVSGGLKITRSRGISVKDSVFTSNRGPGLWIDESVYDSKLVNNDMISNSSHGLSLEISAKAVVANNRIVGNGGNGFKLNDSSDVRIWNNTISGSNRPLNIVQDNRRGDNASDPGHDPRQSFPDPTMTWIVKDISVHNNVLSNTGGGNAILAVEDYSHEFSAAEMEISTDHNTYHRLSSGTPRWSTVWSAGAGDPQVYTNLAAFQSAHRQESGSAEVTASSVLDAEHNLTSAIAERNGSALGLPSDLATLTGLSADSKQMGAYRR